MSARHGTGSAALLENLGGPHLPPVPLSVSARYQVCVDAGVSAAVVFFDELADFGLHDHIACSVSVFTETVRASLAKAGDSSHERVRACVDAFTAGYLGRIHQELRSFREGASQGPGLDGARGAGGRFGYVN
jgi:hypothetical protein